MAYLLNTDVLSLTRRKQTNIHFSNWLNTLSSNEVFLSTMTIGEIEKGIEKQRSLNPDFASDLTLWLEKLLINYSDRIIPVTPEIARRWGKLCQQIGHSNIDILIAATALEYGLIVATRNIDDFKPTGVELIDPFCA